MAASREQSSCTSDPISQAILANARIDRELTAGKTLAMASAPLQKRRAPKVPFLFVRRDTVVPRRTDFLQLPE
ncbi:MAG TPA: hypothetical protein VF493_21515 [Terriglobales bacterium]